MDLEAIISVDIATGGDHGGGRFRMLLKIVLRFTNKCPISRNYEVANVSHSQDNIEILKKTVLDEIIAGLRVIANGGRFVVGQDFNLSFNSLNAEQPAMCDVPIRLFINGDLKFFAQILGRDGMSSSWCMWCQVHPSGWKGLTADGINPDELWSIASQKNYFDRIKGGQLKEAKHKKGIVSDPLIEFIEPSHYIFPQLHFEIGAANNVIDNLRCFIEDEIEQLSNEEKTARNSVIMADVSLEKAKEASDKWKTNGGAIDLHMYRMERVNVNTALKNRNLNQEARADLMDQKQRIDDLIERHLQEQKRLQQDLTLKRKHLKDAEEDSIRKDEDGCSNHRRNRKFIVRLWYYSSQIPWW